MSRQLSSAIVIPARLQSTRLPRKLLLRETGRSVLEHTYESASRARKPQTICVAADHAEIEAEVHAFGGNVQMTDPAAACGTDRVAEVAQGLQADIIVNVQGDEPELSPDAIDTAIALLEENSDAVMSTLATPIREQSQLVDPACVKVVLGQRGNAIYFSRSPVPCDRDSGDVRFPRDPPVHYQHIGLYAYRRDFLLEFAAMPPSPLEQIEKLEQLRALEAGHTIVVGVVDEPTVGIDTPEDYQRFVERMRNRV